MSPSETPCTVHSLKCAPCLDLVCFVGVIFKFLVVLCDAFAQPRSLNISFSENRIKIQSFVRRKYIWNLGGKSYAILYSLQYHHLIEAERRIYTSVNYGTIGSDNGLSPDCCRAIIWTNDKLLSFGPTGTGFSEVRIKIKLHCPPVEWNHHNSATVSPHSWWKSISI